MYTSAKANTDDMNDADNIDHRDDTAVTVFTVAMMNTKPTVQRVL